MKIVFESEEEKREEIQKAKDASSITNSRTLIGLLGTCDGECKDELILGTPEEETAEVEEKPKKRKARAKKSK